MSGPFQRACGANGIIGAKDLRPADAARLHDWLARRGARTLTGTELCRLWVIGTPVGGLTTLTDGAVQGWLLGDLFCADHATAADTAGMLAQAYRARGHRLVWDLTGQFALILWDAERRELALFRDGSSAQGLYHAGRPDGSLLFADRPDLLAECPLLPRRVSRPALHEYLRFLDISTPRTLYDGILSCEPGRLYLHARHGLHVLDAPAQAPQSDTPVGLDAAAAELDRRLAAAVAGRLATTGTTIAFLSGGVDSAYLCALAAEMDPGRIRALTVGFSAPPEDESAVAARIAAHIGVPHEVLRFDLDACREAFDALAAGAAQPFADPAGVPTLLAYRHARSIGDVALDGTGADTLLGIMPARHQRIAVAWSALLPAPARRLLAALMAPLPVIRDYRALVDFGDPEEALVRWHGFERRAIEALCGEHVSLAGSRYYRVFRGYRRHAHYERYSALMGNLPDDRIHVAAALTGLRVRFPFFDAAVADLIRALDRDLRWRPDEPKRVLKAALGRRLPRTLWDVPKHGFDFPFTDLLRHRDATLIHTWMTPARIRSAGLRDVAAVNAMVDTFIAGDNRHAFRIWSLVVLFAWLDTHGL